MKSLIQAVAVAAMIAVPVASFAQSNAPMTRAQVRSQLVQFEKAGYNPASSNIFYPNDVQAAQSRLEAQKGFASAGGVVSGSSASGGVKVSEAQWQSMYAH